MTTLLRCGACLAALLTCATVARVEAAGAPVTDTIVIRGRSQTLRLYGPRNGRPVIVSSGDGGWRHLGPHVAEMLEAKGFFVVGFDVKAYLMSFTSGKTTLAPEDAPRDYLALVSHVTRDNPVKPILIGVSEGAGLSVLASTDPATKAAIRGVIGLGLPDINELGWRWKDALIYLTHGVPNEPAFSTAAIIDRVAPTPLAAIHSTHDEFVPVADIHTLMDRAREPKRLWMVEASNHRFSSNTAEFDQRLLEAIAWIRSVAGD